MNYEAARHYWLPTPHPDTGVFARHAFRGRRWEGEPAEIAVCGLGVAMAAPTDVDWITSPTCRDCNQLLIEEHARR